MQTYKLIIILAIALAMQQCSYSQTASNNDKSAKMENDINKKQTPSKDGNPIYSNTDTTKVNLSEAEWQKLLPKDVYYIARQKGTERPWTSKY